MEAKLTIVGGKANKRQVSVKLPAVIGRSREAGLTIVHPMISRQHCELSESQGLVRIRDLGSLNGTFIGEEQITEAALHPKDQFTVGPVTFQVDYEYAAAPALKSPVKAHSLETEAVAQPAEFDETAQFGQALSSPATPEDQPEPAGEEAFDFLADEPEPAAAPEPPEPPFMPTADSATADEQAGLAARRSSTSSDWADEEEEEPEPTPPPPVPSKKPPPITPRSGTDSPVQDGEEEDVAVTDLESPDETTEGEQEAASSPASVTPSSPPAKRGWWPFGNRKKEAARSETAAAPVAKPTPRQQSAPEPVASSTVFEEPEPPESEAEAAPPVAPPDAASGEEAAGEAADADLDAFLRDLR